MSAATTHASGAQHASSARVGEWFWRFLAVVMVVVIGWVVWIAIQISPPEIILPAAYEAAAQGRALRNSGGTIGVPASATAAPSGQSPAELSAAATAVPVLAVVVEPPVNLEKLKRAESIETPIFERSRRVARPASDIPQ